MIEAVVIVGEVAPTTAPEPVSSVIIPKKLAEDGVVKKVCTPVAVEFSIVPAVRVAVPAVGEVTTPVPLVRVKVFVPPVTVKAAVPFVILHVFVPPARTTARKEGSALAPPEIRGLPAEPKAPIGPTWVESEKMPR